MAGKMKHAARSRKTAKARLRAARLNLCARPMALWMRNMMARIGRY